MLVDVFGTLVRACDRRPAETKVIHDYAVGRVEQFLRDEESSAAGHQAPAERAGRAFQQIFKQAMASEDCQAAARRIVAEYGKLPATPDSSLEGTPGANTIGFAIVVGLAIGTVVAGAIVIVGLATADE
jgi:hypothetical protein